MKDDVRQIIDLICAEQRDVGEQVQPPASAAAIQALVDYTLERYEVELDRTYCEFLTLMNGLDFSGSTIYATAQSNFAKGGTLLGFREMNDAFVQPEGPRYVLYGESGDDFVAQETSGGWYIIDKASPSILEVFASSDDAFERVLRRAYLS